jgi:hypothetical protein
MNPDVEQLRTVLDRLLNVRVGPDGEMLDDHEGSLISCLVTLQFIVSDLYETRAAKAKRLRAVSCS